MGRKVTGFVYQLTQVEISAGLADDRSGGFIEVVNSLGIPTGILMATGAMGTAPTIMRTDGNTAQNKTAAIVAPIATDDSASGFSVGSRWIDTVGNESYVCIDAAVGAAVWSQTTVGTIEEIAGLQTMLAGKEPALPQSSRDILDGVITIQKRTIPAFTSPTAPSITSVGGEYIVSASSEQTSWASWKAVQEAQGGVPNATEWAATNEDLTDVYLKIASPIPKMVTSFDVRGRDNRGHIFAAGWMVQGSNNDIDWDILFTSTEDMDRVKRRHFIQNPAGYMIHRIITPTVILGDSAVGLSVFWLNEAERSWPFVQI